MNRPKSSIIVVVSALLACTSSRESSPTRATSESTDRFAFERDDIITTAAHDGPLRARFAVDGTSIARRAEGDQVVLRASMSHSTSVGEADSVRGGWGGAPSSIGREREQRPPPRLEDGRVTFRREDLVEWYQLHANGIEQGFTVGHRAPRRDGEPSLSIRVEIDGDVEPVASSTPDVVDLRRRSDKTPIFRYGALVAVDAHQRRLQARLKADTGAVIIEVDDGPALYPITIDPLVWTLQTKLTRLGAAFQDFLGIGVAIDGDTVIAGLSGHDAYQGAVAIFRRRGTTWTEEALLHPPYADPASFGQNVALDGDRALVRSVNAAFSYERTGTTWTYQQALPIVDPKRLIEFGNSAPPLALKGELAAIALPDDAGDAGAMGRALFVFEREMGTWASSRVLPDEAIPLAGGQVALGVDTLAVGTGKHVLVYRRDSAAHWQLEATLAGDDAEAFGSAVSVSNDTLIVGSSKENAAYVFKRIGVTWSLDGKIKPPSVGSRDTFGSAIAIRAETAFIGDPDRAPAGAVFRYRRTARAWELEEEIIPPDGTASRTFGSSVSVSPAGDAAVFGAPQQNGARGAAYVYAIASAVGDSCTNAEACASGFCVDGVCCDGACGGGVANDCLVCNASSNLGRCTIADPSVVCRPLINACDVEERCDGKTAMCAADAIRADGTECDGGTCRTGACELRRIPPSDDGGSVASQEVVLLARGGCSTASRPVTGSAALLLGPIALAWIRRRRRSRTTSAGVAVLALLCLAGHEPVWLQRQELVPAAPVGIGHFGSAISVRGDTAIIGRPDSEEDPGAAYVFVRSGYAWTEQAKLVPSDAQPPRAKFGAALAFEGDTAIVGAPEADGAAGAVYVFERRGTAWTQRAKLRSSRVTGAGQFGSAVAIESNTLVIGSFKADIDSNPEPLGAAWVFTRPDKDGDWSERAELGGGPGARFFGAAVALSGGTIVVSAVAPDLGTVWSVPSSVHFFTGSGAAWVEDYVAAFALPNYYAFFGAAVAIDGDDAVVGEPLSTLLPPGPGSAYLYRRTPSEGTWTLLQKIASPDAANGDLFGATVSLHKDRLLVGAPLAGLAQGAAYAFERSGTRWVESHRYSPRTSLRGDDLFGVAIDGTSDSVLVGSPGCAIGAGCVYSFILGPLGTACSTGDGCSSGSCVDGVCCDSSCGGGASDDCMACSVSAGGAKDGVCGPVTPHVCRAARSECDLAESCDGVSLACPDDHVANNGVACTTGTCSGGTCLAPIVDVAADSGPSDGGATLAPPPASGSACAAGRSRAASAPLLLSLLLLFGVVRRKRR